jgi:serine/threonine-protein kinase
MELKNYFWTLPFISFILGYQLLALMTVTATLQNPSIIGLPLTEAIKILSDNNLNPRIMAEKEEPDLPEGTILSQTPAAQQRVKPNQPVFLVVARKPAPLFSPPLLNKTTDEVGLALKRFNVHAKQYYLYAPTPREMCIGQYPSVQEPILGKKMTLYMSAGKNPLMLFPNLKSALLQDANSCLGNYNFTTKVFHSTPIEPEHSCSSCTVVDQKPLPGSIIDVRKPIYVQLQVG